jgi:hypothetical protein
MCHPHQRAKRDHILFLEVCFPPPSTIQLLASGLNNLSGNSILTQFHGADMLPSDPPCTDRSAASGGTWRQQVLPESVL